MREEGVTDKQLLESLLPTTITEAIPKFSMALIKGKD